MLERHKKEISDFFRSSGFSDLICKSFVSEIERILSDDKPEPTKFQGLSIGDTVEIKKNNSPIISYDGKPEGFQDHHVGKFGIVKKFDTKTFSQKNILVIIDGEEIWGHHKLLIKK